MEFKLTKQLKEDWLKALKSGEYEQFIGTLRNPGNHKQMCCLGVLANIIPEITIKDDVSAGECIVNDINVSYDPFRTMGVHTYTTDLASVNDRSYNDGVRDYSQVIPLIEQLETVD